MYKGTIVMSRSINKDMEFRIGCEFNQWTLSKNCIAQLQMESIYLTNNQVGVFNTMKIQIPNSLKN